AVARQQGLDPRAPVMAALRSLEGDLAFVEGDARRARTKYSEALRLARSGLGQGHAATAASLRRLGLMDWALGDLPAARRLREQAMQAALRSPSFCHPELPR